MKKYLERLPGEIQQIIALCSDVALASNVNVYLVGGLVRDLILGVNNFDTFGGTLLRQAQGTSPKDTERLRSGTAIFRAGKDCAALSINPEQAPDFRPEPRRIDLDLVVEGDGISFARALSHRMNAHLIRHPRFGTATLVLGHNSKIDVASSRVECYLGPACLPSVRLGSLRDDLKRRDFTINAMAISINRHDYAKLIDYFDGLGDLKNKKIRVLHDLSFVDDPTRVLRAIRFEQRYNFRIEAHTLMLLKKSVASGMMELVQPQRVRDELILILKEEIPVRPLRRIQELVKFSFIDKSLALKIGSWNFLKSAEREIKWFKNLYGNRRHLDSWLVYFMAIINGLSSSSIDSILKKLVLRKGDEKRIISFGKINTGFIRRLSKNDAAPSDIYGLLDPLSYEVILLIKARHRNRYLQRNIEGFLRTYNLVRLHINGHDLRKVGLKPGPHYQKILKKVLAAKLDREIATKEEELALMRRLSSKR